MSVVLSSVERAMWRGDHGRGTQTAMRILLDAADMLGARSLVEISSAHIDGCLYHGKGGVEFAQLLLSRSAHVSVPTTLNVGALDLLHHGRVTSEAGTAALAHRQMDAYVSMGAKPTFTCAPYQVGHLPPLGAQVAWGESNAIAFVNSVLGARTERYGDFLDACCAVTGRAPLYGLHLTENRVARVIIDLSSLGSHMKRNDAFFPLLGTWLGLEVGSAVTAIEGLPPDTSRDQLKALGAAAASTGAVALFHVVGVTPEAPTLAAACGGCQDQLSRIRVTGDRLWPALERLSTASQPSKIDAVAVGSPHFSLEEFAVLANKLGDRRVAVPFFACTARDTVNELESSGRLKTLTRAGVKIVADTCVVVAPILPDSSGVLMTNSGKFAHYAPSRTGYDVVYGSLGECVESAITGALVRDESLWRA